MFGGLLATTPITTLFLNRHETDISDHRPIHGERIMRSPGSHIIFNLFSYGSSARRIGVILISSPARFQ